jgi:hypothetical protein
MSAGAFTVGDFALFVYFLWFTTDLPGYLGTFLGDIKQQDVAIERLTALTPDAPPQTLAEHHPVYQTAPAPLPAASRRTAADRLVVLDVRGLTTIFPANGRGVRDVSLRLPAGSFTVITGQIGAGKTTLLRALLGLLPHDAGEIRWNGQLVADPATWFQPPRSAYTPQTPRLFSTTLRENILLGLPEDACDLADAIQRAVLTPDVARLDPGVGDAGRAAWGAAVGRAGAAHACGAHVGARAGAAGVRRPLFGARRGDRATALGASGGCAAAHRDAAGRVASPTGAAPGRSDCRAQGGVVSRLSARSTHCWRRRRRCATCGAKPDAVRRVLPSQQHPDRTCMERRRQDWGHHPP